MIRNKIKSLLPQLSFLTKRTLEFPELLNESKPVQLINKEDIDALLTTDTSTNDKPMKSHHDFNFFNSDLNQLYLPLSKTGKCCEDVKKFSK